MMAFCIGLGFLIGQFAGRCDAESRVIRAIEAKPTKENISFGQSLFGCDSSKPELGDFKRGKGLCIGPFCGCHEFCQFKSLHD